MRHDGLFEPEPEPKKKKAKKTTKKTKAPSPSSLGDQITKTIQRSGGMMEKFLSASADAEGAQKFASIEVGGGKAAKQEEKGILVPRIDYVSDGEDDA